jgi:hypothetical protein
MRDDGHALAKHGPPGRRGEGFPKRVDELARGGLHFVGSRTAKLHLRMEGVAVWVSRKVPELRPSAGLHWVHSNNERPTWDCSGGVAVQLSKKDRKQYLCQWV